MSVASKFLKGSNQPRKNKKTQLKSKFYTHTGGPKGKSGIAIPSGAGKKTKRKHGR